MQVTRTIGQTREARAELGRVALVPTMGALHEGHLSLMRRARELADHVAVSIFVNPAQFAPHEDLERYPRPIERDLELCEREGVTLAFNPTVDVMYPAEELETVVEVPALGRMLEGEHRPGFFVGVCRVVATLFNIVTPDAACFGMKDYQQLRVIEAMTRDLSLGVRIVAHPTVRESDGLAMSSRNRYLDAAQRQRALGLVESLRLARALAGGGETDPAAIESAMRSHLETRGLGVGYAVARQGRTLAPLCRVEPGAVALVAARLGAVRLIDNMELLGDEPAVGAGG